MIARFYSTKTGIWTEMFYTTTKSSSRGTRLLPSIFVWDFFSLLKLAVKFDRFSKKMKSQKHPVFGPNLRYLYRVFVQKVIGHDKEHGKRKKTVISDFWFWNFHHTLFLMIGFDFLKIFKKMKIGKLQIFEVNLLTFFRVSDTNVLVHNKEHGKLNKSLISDFSFGKLS